MNQRLVIAGILFSWSAMYASADTVTIELPAMVSGSYVVESLMWTNAGSAPIRIAAITTSCECVKATDYSREIAPGEAGHFSVELRGEKPGDYGYELKVETEDPKQARTYVFNVTVDAQETHRRDTKFYITLAKTDELQKRGHLCLPVDVRPAAEYEKAHIPGSLNMQRYELKAKNFLKEREVLLIDGGWGDDALEAECRKLKEAGFKSVKILYGGMNVWVKEGRALAGNGKAQVSDIRPTDFYGTGKYNDWLLVDMSAAPGELSKLLPAAHRIPFDAKSANGAADDIKKLKLEGKRILIFTEEGSEYDAIRSAVSLPKNSVVFYLAGGLREYSRQLQMNAAIGKGGQITLTSAHEEGGLIGRKPCGSCPGR